MSNLFLISHFMSEPKMIKIEKNLGLATEHARGTGETRFPPLRDEIGCAADTPRQTLPHNPMDGQQVSSSNPASITHPDDPRVIRSPKELKLCPALQEIEFSSVIDNLTGAAGPYDESLIEPVVITRSGTILKGFAPWRSAILNGKTRILCVVSQVDEEEAVNAILMEHRPQCGWNDFIRICLALTQEGRLRKKAIENMSTGGRNKGATNLSEADRIDVALEIAHLAGTGIGNVRKVKLILANAHPIVTTALRKGRLRIHRAWLWCRKSTKSAQKIEFARYLEKQDERKLLRWIATPPAAELFHQSLVMEAVERLAAWHNSISVDLCRPKSSLILRNGLPELVGDNEEPIL